MLKLTWALLCTDSSIDSEKKNISLFQVIDQLNVLSDIVPETVLGIKFQLVFLLRRDQNDLSKKEYKIQVEQVASDGTTVMQKLETPIEFLEGSHRYRMVTGFDGLKISGVGTHFFRISEITDLGLTLLGEAPLDVVVKR